MHDIKKIVHVGYAHSSKDVRIYQKECISLSKHFNAEIYFLTSDKLGKDNSRITDEGIKIEIIPLVHKKGLRLIKFLKDAKKRLIALDADIYHIHEPWLLPLANILHRRGKKVIFDSHENYFKQFKSKKKVIWNIIAVCYNIYEHYVCKKIDAVIVPCTFEGKNIFEGKCKKVEFIDNYVIIDPNVTVNTYDADNFKPILCYVGLISEGRGVTNTILAAYKAKYKLILAGTFSTNAYKAKLEAMKEYSIVDYRGYCQRKEVDEILSESNIGVALLLNQGQYHKTDNMPTKVYEYMQKGLPVIIYDALKPRQVLEKYRFGIAVNPEKIDEIIGAINYIKDHPEEAIKMGQEGRKAVLEEYNWEKESRKLFDLYENVLEQ